MLNNIIGDPQRYAAIYARRSSENDNNSINAQIAYGKTAIEKRDLLLYDIYFDEVSGRSLAPHERKSFKKLLEAAKNGCFKTLIVYRLDRLVRKYNHWLEIKKTLQRLGIKLIFSDETQNLDERSNHQEFFHNFTVMVAEMEPDTIRLRAASGKYYRRKEGAYSSSKPPFGYKRTERPASTGRVQSKSIFQKLEVKLAFVEYIYYCYYTLIINITDDDSPEVSIKEVYTLLLAAITSIELYINNNQVPEDASEDINPLGNILYELYETIKMLVNKSNCEYVLLELQKVKSHFLLVKDGGNQKNTNNIKTILDNSIYAGFMLLEPKHPCKGLKYNNNDPSDYEASLNYDAFVVLNNLHPIIPPKLFEKVYVYRKYNELGKIDRTPNFLLKGKLKCQRNTTLKLIDDNYIHCTKENCSYKNKCFPFIKKDLLQFLLNEIINDYLIKDFNSIYGLINIFQRKIDLASKNAKFYELKKLKAVNDYLTSGDSEFQKIITEINKSISEFNKDIYNYRLKLSYIENLCEELSNIKSNCTTIESNNTSEIINVYRSKMVDYILINEAMFIPIFNEIINEIKVGIKYAREQIKGTCHIKYSVSS
ncbi:MAG: recombinase family protein [Clostridium sp.]|nr:recombinase family protein [Clostridium sp.]MDU7085729.1 recombinase family protein [Clostridium sp.]